MRIAGARPRAAGLALAAAAAALATAMSAGSLAADEREVAAPDVAAAPASSCADDRAGLVVTGDAFLRCENGVPEPRPQPWNTGGCGVDRLPEGRALDVDGGGWVLVAPTACLVGGAPEP